MRRRHPAWPVIVAQSHLHSGYPSGAGHPPSYPYRGSPEDDGNTPLPAKVRDALKQQRDAASHLPGSRPRFVPIDFTRPDDGFTPAAFGLDALKSALIDAGVAVIATIETAGVASLTADITRNAQSLIWGYAIAAGAAGAVPIPFVGTGGLVTLIGLMLRALVGRFGVAVARKQYLEFVAAIGSSALLGSGAQYGVRELVKLIPVWGNVAGAALNATAAWALTFAMGQAFCRYLGMLKAGQAIDTAAIRQAFADGMEEANRRGRPGGAKESAPPK